MKKFFTFFLCSLFAGNIFSQTKGLHFDGIDDNVSINEKAGVLTGTTMTYEAWMKLSDLPSFSALVNKGDGTNYFLVLFQNDNLDIFEPSVPYLTVFLYNGTGNGQTSYNISSAWVNQWHHIAVTYNGATIILYVDGVQVRSAAFTGAIPLTGQPLFLGSYGSDGFFPGTMDEVRIWNVARSAAQIQNFMYTEIPANSAGLAAYYRLNEGTSNGNNTSITTVTDLASSPVNGTLLNFARTGTTSNFTGGYPSLITLPIKTESFIASRKETSIELNWKQAPSNQPATVVIERSENGTSFSAIGSLIIKASTIENVLTFLDSKPASGLNYYRLKYVEADNRLSYSSIVAAKMSVSKMALQIYPVPARNSLQLEINAAKGPLTINVKNIIGVTVKTVKTFSQGNTLFTSVDLSNLSKGTYAVQVNDDVLMFSKQ